MNKTLLATALVAVVATTAFAPTAQAANTGTITISGKVLADTCTVSINGGATVALPTVMTGAFAAVGDTAGTKPFTVNLSGCDSNTTTATMAFSGSNIDAGTGNLNSGGDGVYSPYGQMFNGYHQGTLFGRFSYDLTDNMTFYIQGQGSEAYSFGWYFPQKIQPGANQAAIFYKDNPFLSPQIQAQLGNNGTHPLQTSGTVQPGNTFQLGEFITSLGQTGTNATGSVNRVLSFQTGLEGNLMNGRFNWNLFYTHGENRLAVDLINNQIQFEVVALTLALPHIKDGKIKPLATLTHTRIKELPDVPTIEEAGYADAAFVPWYGIYVPAKTPDDIVKTINAGISKALENPTVRDRLAKSDIPGKPMSVAELAALMKTDETALAAVAKATSGSK